MQDIFLKNVVLGGNHVDIAVAGGLISRISPVGGEVPPGAEVADGHGRTVLPGFVNMHAHAAMSLMRGMQEDVVFQDWISNIWKIESGIDSEYVRWGTKVAAIEMIRTGTTTFNNHYWYLPAARKAAAEMGLRSFESYVVLDQGDENEAARQREQVERMYEESLGWDDGSQFVMGFHAIYSVSEEMILWAKEFADRHNLLLHFHLSETRKEVVDCQEAHGGLSPVEYLDRLGILDERSLAAHTLWLSENDVRILGERKVNCTHNINSNLKLSSGYRFLYNELRDAGANVCIGTDGCASSNNLDMLEAMKTSALVQKAWRSDPKALPLDELLACATVNGARALRLNSGLIREGMLADLILVDTQSSFFLSPGSFLANFIYSAHSDCITDVMSGGRFVMREGQIPGEQEILARAKDVLSELS